MTGEKPSKRWLKEKAYLKFPEDFPVYEISSPEYRRVSKYGFMMYRWNFYEVPMSYASKKVKIKPINDHGIDKIEIYFQNNLIWTHTLIRGRGEWATIDQNLIKQPPKRRSIKASATPPSFITQASFARPLSYYDRILLSRKI